MQHRKKPERSFKFSERIQEKKLLVNNQKERVKQTIMRSWKTTRDARVSQKTSTTRKTKLQQAQMTER
jgi:hypothetical protein